MKLIDLRKESNNSHLTRLTELTAWIRDNEVHRNKKNYINLESTISNFDCFEILYDKNKIVGFSGLYNNGSFPKNIARSCTRTYYHPDYRCKGLNRARWSEKYFIPYEVEKAKEKGYEFVTTLKDNAIFVLNNEFEKLNIKRKNEKNIIKNYFNFNTYWAVKNKDQQNLEWETK